MAIRDGLGRITKLSDPDEHVEHGHSVCGICGKDMPGVWDIVCNVCLGTFCYEDAVVKDGMWNCTKCASAQAA